MSNNTSTKSEISTKSNTATKSNFSKINIVSTYSNISTKSEVSTKSIISTISTIKGDIDKYGNIIEYDPNSWIGEDNIIDKNVNIQNIFVSNNDDTGTLDIMIDKDLMNEKSNILVSLIDEGYNIHNVYVYYKNDYHEKVKLAPGLYIVNNIEYLADNQVRVKASESEIYIKKDETINMLIKKDESRQVLLSTNSNAINTNEKDVYEKARMPFYIYIFIVLGILIAGLAIFKLVNKFMKKEDE